MTRYWWQSSQGVRLSLVSFSRTFMQGFSFLHRIDFAGIGSIVWSGPLALGIIGTTGLTFGKRLLAGRGLLNIRLSRRISSELGAFEPASSASASVCNSFNRSL